MRVSLGVGFLALSLGSFHAYAQDVAKLWGTLTCTAVSDGEERTTSEDLSLSCQFRSEEGGNLETYAGTLKRPKVHQQNAEPLVLIWTVSGGAVPLTPGILEQTYVSARAGQSDPKHLQGQKDNSIILRPFTKGLQTTEQPIMVLDLDLKRTGA